MPRTHLFLLALILAFAAAVRAYGLSQIGYWTDELCTLSDAQGNGLHFLDVPADRIAPPLPVRTRLASAQPISQVVPGMRTDTHPPLYFLLVRLWETAFGDSETAVRSLDVCFSVAAVALLYFAAVPDIGRGPALWACLVMAVASPQVTFAQEARDYGPVLTFSLAAVIALRRLIAQPTAARAIAVSACLLAMMLTHYYAAGVAIALAMHTATVARGRALAYAAAAFAGGAVVFGVVWVPTVIQQLPTFRSGDIAWLTDPLPHHGWRIAVEACQLPIRWVADVRSQSPWIAIAGLPLLAMLPIAFVARPKSRLWVLWVVIPTAIIVGMDLAQGTVQTTLMRYTLFVTPAVYVLLASVAGRWGWLLPAAATVFGLVSLPNAYIPEWKIDLRTPVEAVERRMGPTDGLVVSGPDRVFDAVCFAAAQHYLPRMPAASALLTRPADAPTLDRMRQCPHVWVVWLWPPDRRIDTVLPGYRTDEQGNLQPTMRVAVGKIVTPR